MYKYEYILYIIMYNLHIIKYIGIIGIIIVGIRYNNSI